MLCCSPVLEDTHRVLLITGIESSYHVISKYEQSDCQISGNAESASPRFRGKCAMRGFGDAKVCTLFSIS